MVAAVAGFAGICCLWVRPSLGSRGDTVAATVIAFPVALFAFGGLGNAQRAHGSRAWEPATRCRFFFRVVTLVTASCEAGRRSYAGIPSSTSRTQYETPWGIAASLKS